MVFKDFISKNLPVKRDEMSHPFVRLQQDINRMFENFFDNFRSHLHDESLSAFPKVDIRETDKEVKVLAELPGLETKDLDISVTDNVLTLRGEKRQESERKEENYFRMERTYGSFHRSISLPTEVESDSVNAIFKNGILNITIAKKPEAQRKVKKIEIKTE